jgi:hypothetical protein
MKKKCCTANSQQPITNNQQPTTNNQQPTTNNQQPTTNNQQPTTNNQQPGIRNTPAAAGIAESHHMPKAVSGSPALFPPSRARQRTSVTDSQLQQPDLRDGRRPNRFRPS